MTNNEILNKVNVTKKSQDGITFSFGSLILVLFCTLLIVFSTFLQLNLSHLVIPMKLFQGKDLVFADFVYNYKYIPQIPMIMFLSVFLGRKYGITSVLIYIITGLFLFPVFALGGGLRYIFEYGFGYILGYIPAIFFSGSILKSGYSNRNLLHAAFVGVLTIHIIGILYMLVIALLRYEGWLFMQSWIFSQSGIKIIYDIIFSFFVMFIAKYARLITWAYM
ncbi:biotin transporter BioY [bacterium]|nr:biotin transporter BioY [bacterium]